MNNIHAEVSDKIFASLMDLIVIVYETGLTSTVSVRNLVKLYNLSDIQADKFKNEIIDFNSTQFQQAYKVYKDSKSNNTEKQSPSKQPNKKVWQ